jgi:hypothetical protein
VENDEIKQDHRDQISLLVVTQTRMKGVVYCTAMAPGPG